MNRKEQTVLIFLIAVLASGVVINYLRRPREQSRIQVVSQAIQEDSTRVARADTSTAPQLIDLNHAGAAELDLLPGIGPALSQRIVEYRQRHGGFKTIQEIQQVSGIGPKKYQALRDRITVSPN